MLGLVNITNKWTIPFLILWLFATYLSCSLGWQLFVYLYYYFGDSTTIASIVLFCGGVFIGLPFSISQGILIKYLNRKVTLVFWIVLQSMIFLLLGSVGLFLGFGAGFAAAVVAAQWWCLRKHFELPSVWLIINFLSIFAAYACTAFFSTIVLYGSGEVFEGFSIIWIAFALISTIATTFIQPSGTDFDERVYEHVE